MTRLLSIATALLALPSAGSGQEKLFARLHEMLPQGSWMADVAAGDVDLDGDFDLLILRFLEDAALYANDGSGNFTDVSDWFPTVSPYSCAVALADLDSDGDLDALIGTSSGLNQAYANAGGVFTEIAGAFLVTDAVASMAVGDVDVDGDLDVLTHGEMPPFLDPWQALFLNDGAGHFADGSDLLPPYITISPLLDVALADVDTDGDPDAFFGYFLLDNDGSGLFTEVPGAFPLLLPTSWSIADVDGDSDLDALAGTFTDNRLYLNDGSGVFTHAFSFPIDATRAVLLVNVDGDLDLDALVGNWGQNRLYENLGFGTFVDVPAKLPVVDDWTIAVVARDFDGDGDTDVVFGSVPARLLLNDGSGRLVDVPPSIPLDLFYSTASVLADLDGDGDVDLISNANLEAIYPALPRMFLNDGRGFFQDASSGLPAVAMEVHDVEAADVDADGDLDLFFANGVHFTSPNRLYQNDGAASFTDVTGTHLPAALDETRAAAFGDVDGDGDPDLVLGRDQPWQGRQNALLLNSGGGVFFDATALLPALEDETWDVALGDLDDDGDQDLLVGNRGDNRLHLNDGTGLFTDATSTHLPADGEATRVVALGDVDLDGDLDAVIGNQGSNRLLLNQGGGVLVDAVFPADWDQTQDLVLEDFDGDGDPDVLVGNYNGAARFYLNDGSGGFVDGARLLAQVPYHAQTVSTGDVDGDGDMDAYLGGSDHLILTNLTRQVAWRNVASVGKTLVMDVYGPPLEPWVLVAASATIAVPAPPFGTIYLDLWEQILLSAGLLDAAGRASPAYTAPLDPALIGLTVYWQAVVGWPPRLTNAEATTITDL